MRERQLTGLDHLAAATELYQRIRLAHPTAGSYQAAELQWWWGVPRRTDVMPQLVWFDDDGPAAMAMVTEWGDGTSAVFVDPTLIIATLPGAEPAWIAELLDRGLAHAAGNGIAALDLEVERDDDVMRSLLAERGFERKDDAVVEAWLPAEVEPDVTPLADGYVLRSRAELRDRPHHMADGRRADIEDRLCQTSLYRPDLDLVVLAPDGEPAAFGLFWNDPVSATGVVEPMRTFEPHRQKGLARHILTAGIARLREAGARRISIGYGPENPASGPLYRSIGFEPTGRTDLFGGPTTK